jgi:hypothetical protein
MSGFMDQRFKDLHFGDGREVYEPGKVCGAGTSEVRLAADTS